MNSLTVAIIIGIITAIYSKSKNANKGTTKSKPFSINRGNLQDIYMKLKETATPSNSGFTQPEPTFPKQGNQEEPDKMLQIKDAPSINCQNQKDMKENDKVKTHDGNAFYDLEDNKSIVNAVIWSEILGKPRSKKPYYTKDK